MSKDNNFKKLIYRIKILLLKTTSVKKIPYYFSCTFFVSSFLLFFTTSYDATI